MEATREYIDPGWNGWSVYLSLPAQLFHSSAVTDLSFPYEPAFENKYFLARSS